MKTTRLLVLLVALLSVWQGVFAQNQAYAKLDDYGTLTFYYDGNKNVNDYSIPWATENPAWYNQRDRITKVVFDASFSNYHGLTSTANMFSYLTKMTSIEGISYLNTENVTNMSYMFNYCQKLTDLDLSNMITSNVTNMSHMFTDCIALESLTLPVNLNTSNVTNMSSMFSYCQKLTEINLSNFNTSNVTDMKYMYSGCGLLESLDLSNFNTSNVTDMSNMFSGCRALESLTLSVDFNTSNVTDMSNMFNKCTQLSSLAVSNFSTSNVTDMSYMFNECALLESLDVSNFNTSNVTNMSHMFNVCNQVSSLDVSNFITSNVTDMSNMFSYCLGLKNLDLSNFNTSNVTDMSYMFSNCSSLVSLDLSNFTNSTVEKMNYMFSNCTELKTVDIRNFTKGEDIYAQYMFQGCSKLEEIICKNTWENRYFSMTNYDRSIKMFDGCTNLKGGKGTIYNANFINYMYARPDGGTYSSTPGYFTEGKPYAILSDGVLTFYYDLDMKTRTGSYFAFPTGNNAPGWAASDVASTITTVTFDESFLKYTLLTDAKSLFSGLSNLTTINNLNNLPTTNITDMSYMFDGCSSLTNLDLSEFNTEKVFDMSYMFNGCSSLTNLDFSEFDTGNVTDMSYMFNGCSSLESIYCIDNWAEGNVSSSDNMFAGCESLVGAISYNATKTDISYANPVDGYFSVRKEAYAYIDDDKLIFFYNNNWFNLEEYKVCFVDDYYPNGIDTWSIRKVRFDPSFVDFRPKSTERWFNYFYNLESINGLEYLNTEEVVDMNSMFSNCYELVSLDLSNFDTSNVTDMSFMFASCEKLVSLDLSNFDTSNVTDMSYMFAGCNNLEMIYAGDWSPLKSVDGFNSEGMFNYCYSLPGYDEDIDPEYYDIKWAKPKDEQNVGFFSTRRVYAIVTDDGNLTFHYDGYNSDETTYSIDQNAGGNWKDAAFSTVTFDASFVDYRLISTAEMFRGLTGLTTIYDLDNLNTSNITDMSSMFYGCSGLTTIYCINDWSGLEVPSTDMFAGCTNLEGAIKYSENTDTEHKNDIKYANPYNGYFSQLPQAYAVQEGSVLTFYYDNRINTHSDAIIYEIPWAAGIEGGDEGSGGGYPGWIDYDEGGYAPARRSAKSRTANEPITLVVFDPSFKNYHGLNSTANMFYFMSNLSSIVGLEYLNTENVTTMESMFEGCTSLTSLDLTSFNTEKVTTMESMFEGCSSLTSLDLTSFNTENVLTFHAMFQECSSLTSLNLSNFNTGQAYQLWSMFQDCSRLTTLDLTNFDMSNVTDVDEVFFNCTSLETIFCNDDWSSKSYEYSSDIFWNCVSLKGSNGTTYNDSKNSISYARPDGPDAPGFFTPLSDDVIILYNTSSNTNIISKYAGETKDVLLSGRTLSTSDVWNTLCLPFSLTTEQLAASPLAGYSELRTLDQDESSFDSSTGILNLNFTPATGNGAVTSIEAGKPYIIKWENGGENIVNPTFNGVTIDNSLNPVVASGVTFMGSYDPQPLTSADDDILYIGNNNKLYYPSRDMTINAFRAWFQLTDGTATQIKAINLNFGDEENGIQEITTDPSTTNSSSTYFTLDGRRLLSEPATPGIYIHNGRKVMIK